MAKKMEKTTYPASAEIYSQIAEIGRELASSFRSLLESLPDRPTVSKQLADSLGVDKVLSHRLLTAVRKADPLATAHAIPGPEPLLRVVRAARKRGVPGDVLDSAERAATRFRDLIRSEAGDRSSLDAIISVSLPDARARFEADAKQLAYRGMRQIRGVAAEVYFSSYLVHPRADSERYDVVMLRGLLGLRCVRPGSIVRIGLISRVLSEKVVRRTLDGKPIRDPREVFLPEFCTGSTLETEVQEVADHLVHTIGWRDKVGLRSAGDLVTAELYTNLMRPNRRADDDKPRVGFCEAFPVPVRKSVTDVLLHDEVFPNVQPRTRVYDMGELGIVTVNDTHRESDILDVTLETKEIGRGVGRFRAEEIPFYAELLTCVCTKLGWDPESFRCFRTRMDYPIHGSELMVSFDLPVVG